jgi:glutathione S-transferase
LLEDLAVRLAPFDQMLIERPYLLDEAPRFLDFSLFGVLTNFLFSGHYELPKDYPRIQDWHKRMKGVKHARLQPPAVGRARP